MAQVLPSGSGVRREGSLEEDLTPRVVQYINVGIDQETIGLRNTRELMTLGQSLDALLAGDILLAADTLMQRFKSVELAGNSRPWDVAQHLELVPATSASSLPQGELKAAAAEEKAARRLDSEARPTRGRSPERKPRN